MPEVFNKHHHNIPKDSVYVGRPTKWGNPFTHLTSNTTAEFVVGSRKESIDKYKEWLPKQKHLMDSIHELTGKDLVCVCAPKACHADTLLKLANDPIIYLT